jgi:hypothetical protein
MTSSSSSTKFKPVSVSKERHVASRTSADPVSRFRSHWYFLGSRQMAPRHPSRLCHVQQEGSSFGFLPQQVHSGPASVSGIQHLAGKLSFSLNQGIHADRYPVSQGDPIRALQARDMFRVIERDGLVDNTARVGAALYEGLESVLSKASVQSKVNNLRGKG